MAIYNLILFILKASGVTSQVLPDSLLIRNFNDDLSQYFVYKYCDNPRYFGAESKPSDFTGRFWIGDGFLPTVKVWVGKRENLYFLQY